MDKQLIVSPKKMAELKSRRDVLVLTILSKNFIQERSVFSSEYTASDVKKNIGQYYIDISVPAWAMRSWAMRYMPQYCLTTQNEKNALCCLEYILKTNKQSDKIICIPKKEHKFLRDTIPKVNIEVKKQFVLNYDTPTISYAFPKISHSKWKVPRKYFKDIFLSGIKLGAIAAQCSLLISFISGFFLSILLTGKEGLIFSSSFTGGMSFLGFILGIFASYADQVTERSELLEKVEFYFIRLI